MILNYKEYGSDRFRAVFFLHGLLGSSDNWGSTCRALSEYGFRCIAVDQRNHGSSPHSPEMNYPLMAEDLVKLADALKLERFSVVGHSMGGKTAMEAALGYPERIKSVVVADIAPIQYKPAYIDYIDSLKQIDLSGIKRRSDADSLLAEYVPDRHLRMFFLTNLRRSDGGRFSWRINIDGITGNYENIWQAVEGGRVYNGPVLFIKGGNSGFIQDKNRDIIRQLFPSYTIKVIDGAGHWIHSEKPAEFREEVRKFLADTVQISES